MLLEELELVDDVGLQLLAVFLMQILLAMYYIYTLHTMHESIRQSILPGTYLKPRNLLLDIISKIPKARPVSSVQRTQFPLKSLLIQNLADAHAPPRSLVTVARANSLTGGADLATTETSLLQTVNDGVQIKADVRAVGDEDALAGGVETLGLELGQFLEETWDVDDGAGADQVDT